MIPPGGLTLLKKYKYFVNNPFRLGPSASVESRGPGDSIGFSPAAGAWGSEEGIKAMKTARKFILLVGGLWLALAGTARAQGAAVAFKLFTANCYCFDEDQTRNLKYWTTIKHFFKPSHPVQDLQVGIQKNTGKRRREIATEVIKSNADVAMFQEVWNDKNKTDMLNLLQKKYKYCFVSSRIKKTWTETDDGLFIVSKWPPFFAEGMEFDKDQRFEAEEYAHKGVLAMGLYHPNGGFILVVNTHLQSGTEDIACAIRQHQIGEVVKWLRQLMATDWRIANATIIFGGDLNDPITMLKQNHELFDRTYYQVKHFNDLGININNDQILTMLARKYHLKQIWGIDQQHHELRIQTVGGGSRVMTDSSSGHSGVLRGEKEMGWTKFPEASDPSGVQLLDHLFVDPAKVKIVKFTVMREDFLGDLGIDPEEPMNPWEVISDHAGVLYDLLIEPTTPINTKK